MKNGSTLQEFAERKDSMILKGLYTTLINSDTQYAHTHKQTNAEKRALLQMDFVSL